MSARDDSAKAMLLAPDSVPIGNFIARKFSGGDMLLCERIGFDLASGDAERIKAMTVAQQTSELLQMGALLCHPRQAIQQSLWSSESAAELRDKFIAPVLFDLSPAETAVLIGHTARFFSASAEVAVEVEEKPNDAETGPQPTGNASGLRG